MAEKKCVSPAIQTIVEQPEIYLLALNSTSKLQLSKIEWSAFTVSVNPSYLVVEFQYMISYDSSQAITQQKNLNEGHRLVGFINVEDVDVSHI